MIFLDIDGILATHASYYVWLKAEWSTRNPGVPYPHLRSRAASDFEDSVLHAVPAQSAFLLDAECCARVQRLCDLTGSAIVVSSAWRAAYSLKALKEMFAINGLTADIIGATPTQGSHRGTQISTVVDRMRLAEEDFVILEDNEDVSPFNHRRVKPKFTGPSAGFQERHLVQALGLFGWRSSKGRPAPTL